MFAADLSPARLVLFLCLVLMASCASPPGLPTAETSENVLLANSWDTPFGVPPFDLIRSEHYLPAFQAGMAQQLEEISAITSNHAEPTFANTIEELERSGALLNRVSSAFYPRNSAHTNDELQEVARGVAPLLASHADDIGFDPVLFERVHAVYEHRDQLGLTGEQMRLLNETHKTFIRRGAGLDKGQQNNLRVINGELSELSTRFEDNLLAETNEFELVVDNVEGLSTLPEHLIAAATVEAERRGHESRYVFTLQRPSINPFLQYSDDPLARNTLFDGYAMRGNNDNEHDNKVVLAQIVDLRARRAALLGYDSHAHFVLEDRMAETPAQVEDLLGKVWAPALRLAKKESESLAAMMESEGLDGKFGGSDWRHYSEKLRQSRYALDDELLRPYFEVNGVRDGAFAVAGKLFGITFHARDDLPRWHPDQQAFEVREADGSHLGVLYIDFFIRETKRGGAWENELRMQSKLDGPVAAVVTINFNFPAPTADAPSLLNYTEASTLFHELGHALHDLLSDVTYESLAGTSVARDYVEFPSQVMENWMGAPEVLRMFARHHETGEVIPDDLIAKIEASSAFNQGFITVEYLAASYLDMKWHTLGSDRSEIQDVREFERQAMNDLGLIDEIIPRYRSTYFAHIFSGGYSAGYYSYLWSEVLDADAFEAFKEAGLFDTEMADKFRRLLSRGNTRPGMELYREFRGRDPEIDPLLKRRGMTN